MVCLHAECFSSWVEEPDLKYASIRDVPTQLQRETYKGKFDSEVRIQHELGASPLFFS